MFKTKKKIDNKKGAMMILLLAVITMLALPMLAVMYDIAMIKVARQDVKNLQDLSGIACKSEFNDTFKESCRAAAQDVLNANIEMPSGNLKNSDVNMDRRNSTRLKACGATKGVQGAKIIVDVASDKHSFTVKVDNICYAPVFATDTIFKAFDSSGTKVLKNEGESGFEIDISKSVSASQFHASYNCSGSNCKTEQ